MNARKALTGLALGLLLGLAGAKAWAADKDALTVTITPNVYYAVLVSTGTGEWLDLGTVGMGVSTWTLRPATVTIQSTFGSTELHLQGEILSGWSFSADSATLETDKLVAWAVFTDTSVAESPSQASGYFNGTTAGAANDMLDATDRHVGGGAGGEDGGTGTRFLAATTDAGYKPMDSIPNNVMDLAASRAHLWLRFRTPGGSSTPGAKKILFTLTALQPNT